MFQAAFQKVKYPSTVPLDVDVNSYASICNLYKHTNLYSHAGIGL